MIDRAKNRMFVKPAKGLKIRKYHAIGGRGAPPFLAVAGEWVPRTVEWGRAVKSGDVTLTTPPKPAKAAKSRG